MADMGFWGLLWNEIIQAIHPTMERRIKIEVYSEAYEERDKKEQRQRAREKKLNSSAYMLEDGQREQAIMNTMKFDKEGTGQFLEDYERGYQERRRMGIAPELEPSEWIENFYKRQGIYQVEMEEDDIIRYEQEEDANSERCVMCGETLPLISCHCDACGYLSV